MDYAVTLTGPAGGTEAWEDALDVLPDCALLGWPEDRPRLIFTVEASSVFDAAVEGLRVAREAGVQGEQALVVEPSPED